jgi:hypothetical protein
MSTFRLISDIHSEFWPENFHRAAKAVDRLLPPRDEDRETVLLLAGDTGSYRRRNVYRAIIDRLCDRFNAVVDIPGNHYWYGRTDWDICEPPSARDNYVFGHTVNAFGVVAATLWTNFHCGDPETERRCSGVMNDFRQIPFLTTDLIKERHQDHIRFLRENVRPGGFVMTHFAPSLRSLPVGGREGDAAGYYASNLEALILGLRPAVWVHGHIHTACDYRIGQTRIVCNPAGYDGKGHNPALSFSL